MRLVFSLLFLLRTDKNSLNLDLISPPVLKLEFVGTPKTCRTCLELLLTEENCELSPLNLDFGQVHQCDSSFVACGKLGGYKEYNQMIS